MTTSFKIPEILKRLRTEKKLSQSDIADYLGITGSAYGYYEQGVRQPNITVLQLLSDFYDVTTDYLLGRSDIRNSKSTDSTYENSGSHDRIEEINTLGKRIKSLRESKGLTQKDLAALIGITPKAISFYELSQREPSNELLVLFSNIFNVSVDYLLGLTDEKYKNKDKKYIMPVEFTNPIKAREYIGIHQTFGLFDFNSDKLSDDEILNFANDLLYQAQMVSYKYKK